MKARKIVAWGIAAGIAGGFLLLALYAPASPRGSLSAPGISNSFYAIAILLLLAAFVIEPQYAVLSWLAAAGFVLVSFLLDEDIWSAR